MQKNDLKLVFWETTKDCNLSCLHCRMENTPGNENMKTHQAFQLIDSISAFAKPILILSGGEPLTRPDIFNIAEYTSSKGIPVALATNGTLINDEVALRIKESGIKRVSISFDGINSHTHDTFRNTVGSFDSSLNGLQVLVKNKISTQVNTTITKLNVVLLEDFVKFAIDNKADAIHFFLVVPVGCGMELAEDVILTTVDYENTLDKIFAIEQKYKKMIFIKVTCAPQYYRNLIHKDNTALKDKEHLHKTTKGCLAGTNVCFISASGDVYPCGYLPVKAGNLFETSLEDIWTNSEVFNNLRDFDKYEPNCSTCNSNRVCGGCRARAYADSLGNYLAKDSNCKLNW